MSSFTKSLLTVSFVISGISFASAGALPDGCTSTTAYSPITGMKCSSTLPDGCTTSTGYSPLTGIKCDSNGTQAVTPVDAIAPVDTLGTADSCLILSNNLSYGMRDANTNGEVSELQSFLKDQGYLKGNTSGSFGINTRAAVKLFQASILTNIVANNIDSTIIASASDRSLLATTGFRLTNSGNVATYTRGKIAYVTCHGGGVSTAPSITTTTLPNGVVGTAYSGSITSTGGIGTRDWNITSGALPPGVYLNKVYFTQSINGGTGSQPEVMPFFGTPTTAGTYTFTATVTTGSQSASKQFSIVIANSSTGSASNPVPALITGTLTSSDGRPVTYNCGDPNRNDYTTYTAVLGSVSIYNEPCKSQKGGKFWVTCPTGLTSVNDRTSPIAVDDFNGKIISCNSSAVTPLPTPACIGTHPAAGNGVVLYDYTNMTTGPSGPSNTVWAYGQYSCGWGCTAPMLRDGENGCKNPTPGTGVRIKINKLDGGSVSGISLNPSTIVGLSIASAVGAPFTTDGNGSTPEFWFDPSYYNNNQTVVVVDVPGYKIRNAIGCTSSVEIWSGKNLNRCANLVGGNSINNPVTINLVPGDIASTPIVSGSISNGILSGSVVGGDPNHTWGCIERKGNTDPSAICTSGYSTPWRLLGSSVDIAAGAAGWNLVSSNQGDKLVLQALPIAGYPADTYTMYVRTGTTVLDSSGPSSHTSFTLAMNTQTSPLAVNIQSPKVLGDYTSTLSCSNLSTNMHRGAESQEVRNLQTFLSEKGFFTGGMSGFYGDKTVEAVMDYQASKGLPITGMVYDFTREAIRDESCQ